MANTMGRTQVETIDNYIAGFPEDVQKLLKQMREIISKAAPKAEEAIKYAMPTFTLHGNLVHFAGYKNHIGFYPAPSGIESFKEELSQYKNSKGAVQFPLDKPLPVALITKIVKFRVKESIAAAELKTLRKAKR
ncbi:iron chaperone [Flavitalea sp.]|nr:DUF1801 domain-containing protein [Flavitalea sp.]